VNADQIFIFDKGRIIESGTYDELMSFKNSYYWRRRFYNNQRPNFSLDGILLRQKVA
jgi:ABC-type multidrug transport system fused ATPase/permease subunit